ncbi:hypothetical protein BC629DRAFT_781073 [Irpex lacteus]|nr:hypothetical protein BC629DRAFT_781073 [Irpex lacteus]
MTRQTYIYHSRSQLCQHCRYEWCRVYRLTASLSCASVSLLAVLLAPGPRIMHGSLGAYISRDLASAPRRYCTRRTYLSTQARLRQGKDVVVQPTCNVIISFLIIASGIRIE